MKRHKSQSVETERKSQNIFFIKYDPVCVIYAGKCYALGSYRHTEVTLRNNWKGSGEAVTETLYYRSEYQ